MLLSVCGDEMTEVHVLTKNFSGGKKKQNSAVIDGSKCAVFGFPSGPLLGVSLNNFNLGGTSEARSPGVLNSSGSQFCFCFFSNMAVTSVEYLFGLKTGGQQHKRGPLYSVSALRYISPICDSRSVNVGYTDKEVHAHAHFPSIPSPHVYSRHR